MSIITSGRYTLRNVRQGNLASLQDPNDGTPLTADTSGFRNTNKWNVTQLGNGRYTFQNVDSGRYANGGNRSPAGSAIEGRSSATQFVVQETRVKGRYTIATLDSRLYWGLADAEVPTSVELAESAVDQRNWWIFEPVQ
ncbi:hypothetical protein BDP27DRAFT_1364862 [Rhodocollybia butyracea]|uniref:Ricin B lectin domain-containing protein n=1 Tax=Rhodocollybia butyracea TaxID=206335 RepID=A0A9P5PQV3_9AGAR|nr:hypothetical protein BDP27DRAFT_1364862 [Rhodocollybia butyracea]